MRVQVDDLPRMESTRTSSVARSRATSACLLFHRSRPARAASLSGEFATTTSGIFARGFFTAALAIPDSAESARRDCQVVAYEVELRELRLFREVQLLGMRHANLAPLDGEHLDAFFFPH
jgi:hypothetical protein